MIIITATTADKMGVESIVKLDYRLYALCSAKVFIYVKYIKLAIY